MTTECAAAFREAADLNHTDTFTVTHPDRAVTTFGYDKAGNRQSVSRATSATATPFSTTGYTYDSLNRLTDIVNKNGSSAVVSSYHYGLRLDGKRYVVTESGPATNGGTTNYTYDDAGKLTQEAGPYATIAYGYDNVGNRLTRTVTGSTTALLPNGLTTNTYDNNDRVLTVNGAATHTYDLDGNEQTVNGQTASYDFENHLVSLGNLGSTASYVYDADGNRVSVSSTGTTTDYAVDTSLPYASVIEEYAGGSTAVSARYDYGDDLVRMDRSSGVYYYLYDGLGSTRQLINTSGAVTDSYGYSAFGEMAAHTGSTVNPFLFNAQQFDGASGDYFLRARYYDQSNGRFISQDPFKGDPYDPVSLHRYLYSGDEPVDYIDPGGRDETAVQATTTNTIGQTIASFSLNVVIRAEIFINNNYAAVLALQTIQSVTALVSASNDPDNALLYFATDGVAGDAEVLAGGASFLRRAFIARSERLLALDVVNTVRRVDNISWGTSDSVELRENMRAAGIPPPPFLNAAHHIVAGGEPLAEPARRILTAHGIRANDPANGVFLNMDPNAAMGFGVLHRGSHSHAYYEAVNQTLEGASSRADVVYRLQGVAEGLKQGTFPW